MLFVDDIVLVGKTREELSEELTKWRRALESRGFRISRSKTEYIQFNLDEEGEVLMDGEEIKKVSAFKYLGSHVSQDGELDVEVRHRIQSGWNSWRKLTGILCARRVSVSLKGKIYKTAVRPAMLYGSETWAVKRTQEKRMNVAEMRMLRWMCGVTRRDRVRNEHIRGTVKVAELSSKMQERRLNWYGHVMRDEEHIGRRAMELEVPGRRGRGRPKYRWGDRLKEDLQVKGVGARDVVDRKVWKELVKNSDPI